MDIMMEQFAFFFFFNDTATTEIYTLSLHDALPISRGNPCERTARLFGTIDRAEQEIDRKSTRLNSSHSQISYAVFCLKKKKRLACGYSGHSFPLRLEGAAEPGVSPFGAAASCL